MTAVPGLSVRRDVNVPYYEQLKRLVVQQIQDDGLQPGDVLPSEAEIGDQHGVSRTVVRQAIGDLVASGMLVRMRGKGTFVAEPKLREQFMESTVGFFEDLTQQGHQVLSEVMSIEIVPTSDHIASAMGVAVGTEVIELVRLRLVDDVVVALVKSYVNSSNRSLLADLRNRDLEHASLYKVLEDDWGLRIESGQRSLEASKALGELAKLLQVRAGEPVMYIESVGRDQRGHVVEYFQAWHRADRTRLEINVVRNKHAVNMQPLLISG